MQDRESAAIRALPTFCSWSSRDVHVCSVWKFPPLYLDHISLAPEDLADEYLEFARGLLAKRGKVARIVHRRPRRFGTVERWVTPDLVGRASSVRRRVGVA